jgi:hypothetical protein
MAMTVHENFLVSAGADRYINVWVCNLSKIHNYVISSHCLLIQIIYHNYIQDISNHFDLVTKIRLHGTGHVLSLAVLNGEDCDVCLSICNY